MKVISAYVVIPTSNISAARIWNNYPSTLLLHLRCLSSGHASRLIFLLFTGPVPDHVQCLRNDTCHFGHFNRSCYLLTYLLHVVVNVLIGGSSNESRWNVSRNSGPADVDDSSGAAASHIVLISGTGTIFTPRCHYDWRGRMATFGERACTHVVVRPRASFTLQLSAIPYVGGSVPTSPLPFPSFPAHLIPFYYPPLPLSPPCREAALLKPAS